MKNLALFTIAAALMMAGCKPKSEPVQAQEPQEGAAVYLTKDISPEGLLNIYKALGVEANGRVAIK